MFSLLIYGAGTATNLQTRYAGTDLAAPTQRATAISIVMVSTTFGAVAGPNLVNVMGKFAESIGVPALAGPYILAAAAYIVAGLILLALLRPDPLVVAKALAEALSSTPSHSDHSTGNTASINKKGVIIGATVISRCLDRVGRSIWWSFIWYDFSKFQLRSFITWWRLRCIIASSSRYFVSKFE